MGVFVKYGEEEHLKQIVDGSLRFSPSEVYVKMEEEQHNKGQGDMLDGKWVINNVMGGRLIEEGTGRVYIIPSNARFFITIQDVNSMPVFCLSYYDEQYITEEDSQRSFYLPEDKVNSLKHDFPKATHALLIFEQDVFIEEVQKAEGHKIISDRIHYFNFDTNEIRMASFLTTGNEETEQKSGIAYTTTYEDRYRHLLCKDNNFKDQDEYRFIILDELIKEPKKYSFEFKSAYKIVPIDDLVTGVEVDA